MKKLLLFLLLTSMAATAQIDRMEPPFWYAGMHNPELEIMFYGKNISQYVPSVTNGIQVKKVTKTENPNYIFVTIDTKDVPVSNFVFNFKDSKGKTKFKKDYSLKQRRPGSAQRKSFDSSDLVYLIM